MKNFDFIKKVAGGVLLISKNQSVWDLWERNLLKHDTPIMMERNQPDQQQERESFELGLAIGSGAYVYLLRSRHQKRPKKEFSDLSGILEYRYTRPGGRLSFQANLIGDIYSKLQTISESRARMHHIGEST